MLQNESPWRMYAINSPYCGVKVVKELKMYLKNKTQNKHELLEEQLNFHLNRFFTFYLRSLLDNLDISFQFNAKKFCFMTIKLRVSRKKIAGVRVKQFCRWQKKSLVCARLKQSTLIFEAKDHT